MAAPAGMGKVEQKNINAILKPIIIYYNLTGSNENKIDDPIPYR